MAVVNGLWKCLLFRMLLLLTGSLLHGASAEGPPVFTLQPQDQTVYIYTDLQIQVGVLDRSGVGFNWWKDDKLIWAGGPSDFVYFALRVEPPASGRYFCVATNAFGSSTSSVAVILVTHPPPTPGSTLQAFERQQVDQREVYEIVEEAEGTLLLSEKGEISTEAQIFSKPTARVRRDGSLVQDFSMVGGKNLLYALPDGRFWVGTKRYLHDGTLDTTFKPLAPPDPSIHTYLPDGGIVTLTVWRPSSGDFTGLIRLEADGARSDNMFPGFLSTGQPIKFTYPFKNLPPILKPDGKFVMVASGNDIDPLTPPLLSQLIQVNPDGLADPNFNVTPALYPPTVFLPSDQIPTLMDVLNDGRIAFVMKHPTNASYLPRRLNSDGSQDLSFSPSALRWDTVDAQAIQSDGKWILAVHSASLYQDGNAHLIRLNVDGSLDTNFNCTLTKGGLVPVVNRIRILRDGNIAVGGYFSRANNYPRQGVAILRGGPFSPPQPPPLTNVVVQPGRPYTLSGGDGLSPGTTLQWFRNGEPLPDGTNSILSPPTSFLTPRQFDYSLLASNSLGVFSQQVARVVMQPVEARPGALDPTFQPEGLRAYNVLRIAEDPLGHIVAGGLLFHISERIKNGLVRFDSLANLEESFSPGTFLDTIHYGDSISSFCFLQDGRYIATTAQSGSLTPIREVLKTGNLGIVSPLDTTRRVGTALSVEKLDPNGLDGYYIATTRAGIIRTDSRFFIDTTFGPVSLGSEWVSSNHDCVKPVSLLTLDNQKRPVIFGQFTAINGIHRQCIARINKEGVLDISFNSGDVELAEDAITGLTSAALSLPGWELLECASLGSPLITSCKLDAAGRLIVSGAFTSIGGVKRQHIARLLDDGKVDPSFDPGIGPDGPVVATHIQPDGRILVGGAFKTFQGQPRLGIARLNEDGSLDTRFDPGAGIQGTNPGIACITQQRDGRILISGHFTGYDGVKRPGIARLINEPQLLAPTQGVEGLEFSLTAIEGRDYTFEYTTSLQNPVWKIVSNVRAASNTLHFEDTHAWSENRFYRVRVE